MKEMSTRRFMNVNKKDECEDIYIKSEREKMLARRFVIFKYEVVTKVHRFITHHLTNSNLNKYKY